MAKDFTDDVLIKTSQIIDKYLIYPLFFDKDNEDKKVKDLKKEIINSLEFIFESITNRME